MTCYLLPLIVLLVQCAIERIWLLLTGIVALSLINGLGMPPKVSIANVNGLTSKSKSSFTSPAKTPPWTAAP